MKKNLIQKLAANLNRSWIFAACASSLAAMIGCTSIGEQYVPPSSNQPSATLVPKEGNVFINTHDEKGCYQGRTELRGIGRRHSGRAARGHVLITMITRSGS